MKNILIVGFLGNNNLGDDLMYFSTINFLMQKKGNVTLKVMSFDKRNIPQYLLNIKEGIEGVDLSPKGRRWYRVYRVLEIFRNIKKTNVVFFNGGTLFFDNVDRGFLNFFGVLRIFLLALILKRKIYFYGVGIGELNTFISKKIVSFIINNSEVFAVRDDKSYVRANSLSKEKNHIYNVLDPCLIEGKKSFLINYKLADCDSDDVVISFCLMELFHQSERRSDLPLSEDDLVVALAEFIRDIYEKNNSSIFQFISFQDEIFDGQDYRMDMSVHQKIIDLLPDEVNVRNFNAIDFDFLSRLAALNCSSAIIGMRYHSLVIGYIMDKKLITLSATDKTASFMNDIGLQDSVIDLRKIRVDDINTLLKKIYVKDRDVTKEVHINKRLIMKKILNGLPEN